MAFIEWKKCLKEPNQLIKLIVLVIFVCITAYQLSECIGKILSPPVTTYYKFRLNDSIQYPSVTICRRPAYKNNLFPSLYHQSTRIMLLQSSLIFLVLNVMTFVALNLCQILVDETEELCSALDECPWYVWNSSNRKLVLIFMASLSKFPSIQVPGFGVLGHSNLVKDFNIKATTQLSSDKSFQNFPFDKHTIADFLKQTTYSQKEMIPIYGYGGTGSIASSGYDNVEIKSTYFLNKGVCHTFIPKVNSDVFAMSGGYYLYVRHTVMQKDKLKDEKTGISTSGFDVYMHGENEILTGEDDQENSLMETIYLESSEDMNVNLKLQTFSQLSSKDDPCVSDPGYSKSKCEESCIHYQMAKKVNCTLPWLRIDASEFQQCSDYQSVNKLIATLNSDRKSFLKHCTHCKISCNLTIYSTQILSRKEAEAFVQPGGSINLYFSSNLITQMEEVISYDWNIFLSDVGASLGFLLGLSVIGIAAILEEVIRWVIKSCAKKNKRDGNSRQEIREEEVYQKEEDAAKVNEHVLEGKSFDNLKEFLGDLYLEQDCKLRSPVMSKEVERY